MDTPSPTDLPPRPASAPAATADVAPISPGPYAWVGSAIGLGFAIGLLWLVVDSFYQVNGVGLLRRQPWPLSSPYLCAAAGAVVGAACAAAARRRARRHARAVAEAGAALGFAYAPTARRDQLADYAGLGLLRHYAAARHRLTGRWGGLPVELIDYTFVEEGGSEADTHRTQTVALLPAPEGTPTFELRPRDGTVRLVSALLGIPGITFGAGPEPGGPVDPFNRSYFLSPGLEGLLARWGGVLSGATGEDTTVATREDATEAVRAWFTEDRVRFFAGHPGWCVESDGRYVAVYRRDRLVPAEGRPPFLDEVLAVREALARGGGAPLTSAGPSLLHAADPARWTARMGATVLGAFAGFFTGGILGLKAAFAGDIGGFGKFLGSAALFVGGTQGGLALGAFLGNRLIYHPLYAFSRRRKRRP
jgi:hypothetical protein